MTKPLEGPCEAGLSYETGPGASIYGVKCHRPGVLRMEFLLPFGVILCSDCYYRLKAKESHTLPLASTGKDA